MDGQPLRVVIAEDSVLLREGLARLIEDWARSWSPGSATARRSSRRSSSTGRTCRSWTCGCRPTQRDEGLRAAIEARRRVPGTPVLVLSQYVERQYASELLADGAGGVGYLLKDRVADVREFMERACAGSPAAGPRSTRRSWPS